jgi:hypothetical protein
MPGRDAGEIEALVTDRYLDALLAGEADLTLVDPAARTRRATVLDAAVRAASRRLAADLPRFHPSFRFEERLALQLAEAAAALRQPQAGDHGAPVVRIPLAGPDPLGVAPDDELGDGADEALRSPLFLRGAVAASALSLAGAAWYAWRHRAPSSPMARAARAAHAAHPSPRQLTGSGRV